MNQSAIIFVTFLASLIALRLRYGFVAEEERAFPINSSAFAHN